MKGMEKMPENSHHDILKRPLITEKTTALTAENKYTFEVIESANKIELKKAFEKLFPGRKVVNLQTTKIYPHQKRVGRRTGHTPAGKKAVFTIEGDPIELFTGV